MSASLLRGLRILEMLRAEPLGVSEVARRLGVDKAGVSRVLRSLLDEGWVERTGRLHVLGPRALLLTAGAPTTPFLESVGQVARRLRTETGHTAVVLQLRSAGAQPLAVEPSETTPQFAEPEAPFEHLWATAGGLALLAQLPAVEVAEHLAVEPWPRRSSGAPGNAEEVWALLERLRRGEPVVELSWTIPGLGCVALPWAAGEGLDPVALALLGPEPEIDGDVERLSQSLRAAAVKVA